MSDGQFWGTGPVYRTLGILFGGLTVGLAAAADVTAGDEGEASVEAGFKLGRVFGIRPHRLLCL